MLSIIYFQVFFDAKIEIVYKENIFREFHKIKIKIFNLGKNNVYYRQACNRHGKEKMANKSLEQYLKDLRKSCNYSQEFVASHLNITRQTYSHYETGRITPPVNSLYNLAKLYGIPVENLLDLVVTYNINMDFARNPQVSKNDISDELSLFIDFINAPENSKKFKFLNKRERLLLFYFLLLDARDQEDILSFMKVKYLNRSNDKQYYDDKQSANNNE